MTGPPWGCWGGWPMPPAAGRATIYRMPDISNLPAALVSAVVARAWSGSPCQGWGAGR